MKAMLAASVLLAATAAMAQEQPSCGAAIERAAERVPDLSENPNAHEKLGLTVEQLQAVLATLDAARLVQAQDGEGCIALVEAAQSILDRGNPE